MAHLLKLGIALAAISAAAPLPAQRVVPHEAVSQPGPIDSTTQTDDVAFAADLYDRMTVPVLVSGAGPYRFLVDTGADRTAISRELADRLRLARGRTAELHSVAGAGPVQTAHVPLLELSRNRVERIDAPLLEQRHMGADGILGVDSLRSQRVMFDFQANILSIVPSRARSEPEDRNAIVVTAKRRKGHLILTQATANGHRVNVIIDTGAEVSIANSALRKRLRIRAPGDSKTMPLLSVTGHSIDAREGRIDRLDIGEAVLEGLVVAFVDAHIFRRLGMDDRPTLLLGMNAMRAFDRVSIDFANKTLRFVLPKSSAIPGPRLAAR